MIPRKPWAPKGNSPIVFFFGVCRDRDREGERERGSTGISANPCIRIPGDFTAIDAMTTRGSDPDQIAIDHVPFNTTCFKSFKDSIAGEIWVS